MKLDITIHKGQQDKPAIVFIHGLGMNKNIWVNPDEAKMLGGNFPIRYLLAKKPEPVDYSAAAGKPKIRHSRFSFGEAENDLKTSFADLKSLGYTVIAWSQRRPAGPIAIAAAELKKVAELSKEFSKAGIILIGHSRGGLIARRYLENRDRSVTGLITLASPHNGSSMAKLAGYISPLASIISPLIHEEDRKKIAYVIKRVLDFIKSKALLELLPDSEFFRSLKDYDHKTIQGLSFGGTNPNLFTLYRWKLKEIPGRGAHKWLLEPETLFSIPDILEKIIPGRIYPEELKKGLGDGLVSAKSSILLHCKEHHDFDLNHATILFDEGVRKKIIKAVGMM
ncbi:MAG: hypothetical protein FD156_1500 [Nitrospirae bacterium]|nr:MAG: hypothetical protein FD156_1500 [Nitrospirota bacterium]